jgi:hypothetical protein
MMEPSMLMMAALRRPVPGGSKLRVLPARSERGDGGDVGGRNGEQVQLRDGHPPASMMSRSKEPRAVSAREV